jgi:F-type H+-transporting ATPase subunit b
MPQFNLANFMPQLVWLALFFAILYFGVVRLTLPKLGRVMTAREDQVTGDLANAEKAKGEADRMAADYDASVLAAQDAARAKLGEARTAATAALEARLAASNAALDAKANEAQAGLDAALDKALGQIESIAAEAAADIVERVTGRRPAEGEAATAARASLA